MWCEGVVWCGAILCFGALLAVETGGIMITPRPAPPGVDLKPAFPMIPFFGVQPCLMDAEVCSSVTERCPIQLSERSTLLYCVLLSSHPSPGPGD